jgi:sugar lactone lactonase YvrE
MKTLPTTTLLACSLVSAIGCGNSMGGSTNNPPDGSTTSTADATPFTKGVSTLAGSSETGSTDGDRVDARFSNPVNVVRGSDGTIYVADFDNGLIRTIDSSGNVATLIKQPGFARPFGMTFAPDGTLFVETDKDPNGNLSDTAGTIWRVNVAAKTATVVKTGLGRPRGLVMLPSGQLAMSDYVHHVIQTLDVGSGAVATIAGTWDAMAFLDAVGPAARFSSPYGMALRGDGMLLVTDFGNNRVRIVDPTTGTTTTFAGAGTAGYADGSLATAQFNEPQGISLDAAGDVFITDMLNFRIRRIVGTTVDTIAGNGTGGWLDSDNRTAAELFGLEGLIVTPDGQTVTVADGNRGNDVPYNRVREITMQ